MANETKHTPGPWHVAFGGKDTDDYAIIGSKFSERAICNMEPRDYVQANARLIAAAPELLEALKGLLDQLNGIGIPDWHGAEGLSLEETIAAINKAEGQE
jgi:hypothetical protein